MNQCNAQSNAKREKKYTSMTREHSWSLFARGTPSLVFFCLPPSCQCRVRTSLVFPPSRVGARHVPLPGAPVNMMKVATIRSSQVASPVEPLPCHGQDVVLMDTMTLMIRVVQPILYIESCIITHLAPYIVRFF